MINLKLFCILFLFFVNKDLNLFTLVKASHPLHLTEEVRTRSADNYSINRVEFKLSLARSNFFYQSSRLWSALPDHVKSANNKSTFKNRCKSWVKANIMIKP